MGFEGLLGNEQLRENLSRSINKGRGSHFYLISGPEGSGKRTLAAMLAAAILCKGSPKPCGSCAHCRKVAAGSHPDFITIDDPEKKTVPIDLVRKARADLYVMPNEADKKIYLFPRAQDMQEPSQNALLKVLEEPPAHGVLILVANNPEKLLPTVRSRCVELALRPLPDKLLQQALEQRFPNADSDTLAAAIRRSGGFLGQAIELLQADQAMPPQTLAFAESYAARDTWAFMQVLVPMERWKREQLHSTLVQWLTLLQTALVCRSGGDGSAFARKIAASRSARELTDAIGHLKTATQYVQANVSPAAICGFLEWALR